MKNKLPSGGFTDAARATASSVAIGPDATHDATPARQLRQAVKTGDGATMVCGIAHDFKNILHVIAGFTRLALDTVEQGTKLHAHLTLVLDAANRGERVVSQMLSLSRRSEQEKRPIDIRPIVEETVAFLRASVPEKVSVRFTISDDMHPVLADPTQFHQLLMNLCTNSVHSMRDRGGLLHVAVGRVELDSVMAAAHPNLGPGSYLRVTVSDTGCGMTPDVMGRIFEPYFTTKKSGDGHGLGLAVVYRIVEGHGGVITVESAEGAGTTCQAFFPTVECAAASCPLRGVAPFAPTRKESSMGLLRDDLQHLRTDMEHIHGDIEHVEKDLEQCQADCGSHLSELRTHVRDLDAHLHDVLSHVMHVEEHSRTGEIVREAKAAG